MKASDNKIDEIATLTGIRGLAALCVFIAHYDNFKNIPYLGFIYGLFLWHGAAVDLFFFLSGFILCIVYKAGTEGKLRFYQYGTARIARIFPLYAITLLITTVFIFYKPLRYTTYPIDKFSIDLISQLLMLNAWPIGSGVHYNFPSWSVSIEFFCYIVIFPILFRLHTRHSPVFLLILICGASVTSVFFSLHFGDIDLGNPFFFGHHKEIAYWVPLITGVSGFIIGWALYCSFINKDWLWSNSVKFIDLFFLCFLLVLIYAHIVKNTSHFRLTIFLFPFILLGLSSTSRSISYKFFVSKPMLFLGDCSYSIYLWHIPIRFMTNKAFLDLSIHHPVTWAIINVVIVLGVSYLSYRFLEIPLRNSIRRLYKLPGKTVHRSAS